MAEIGFWLRTESELNESSMCGNRFKFLSISARQFSYSIVCVVLFGLCNYKSLKPLKGDHGRN